MARRLLPALALVGLALSVPSTPTGADTSSTQQIVVSAASYASTSGALTAYQQTAGVWHAVYGPVAAELGVHGLSDNRSEGDGTTPTGTYGFAPTMYGVADAAPSARYAYHHLVCGDWWSGVRDATYNTFQHIDCGQTMDNSEALWQQTTAYQHFAVIDFNANPTVIGKGSAIFLHDSTSSGVTAGCVAIAPSALDAVLSWLDPAQNPVIRIGARAQVGPPSPLATPPTSPPAPPRTVAPRPALIARPVAPHPTPPSTTRPVPATTTSTTEPPTTTTAAAPLEFAAAAPVEVQRAVATRREPSTALAAVAGGLLVANLAGAGLLRLRRHLNR